jgi:Retroviral aspartyl protease
MMLDSGSTHFFLNPAIVHNLSIPIVECLVLQVTTVSGIVLTTSNMCGNLVLTIQGHAFNADLRVLHVPGYDLILGIDWLALNNSMNINWKTGVIKLLLQGKKVTLQSQPVTMDINLTEPIVNIPK